MVFFLEKTEKKTKSDRKKGRKKISKIFKLYVPSQNAQLKSVWAPFLTPYLNKEKLNIFCEEYNRYTRTCYSENIIVPVFFVLFENRSYTFFLKTPTFFYILKCLYNLDKIYNFSQTKFSYYYITLEELFLISNIKKSVFFEKNILIILKILIDILKKFDIKIIF